jgi:3-phenylpropionate/cinnamic acid dioxygenase small subunit
MIFVQYRHAIYVMTCKLFADIERLKVREAEKAAEEKFDDWIAFFLNNFIIKFYFY